MQPRQIRETLTPAEPRLTYSTVFSGDEYKGIAEIAGIATGSPESETKGKAYGTTPITAIPRDSGDSVRFLIHFHVLESQRQQQPCDCALRVLPRGGKDAILHGFLEQLPFGLLSHLRFEIWIDGNQQPCVA